MARIPEETARAPSARPRLRGAPLPRHHHHSPGSPRSYSGRAPDTDSAVAAALEVPMPEERRDVLRSEGGVLLDRLLATRARRKAAYEVAIGEYLAAMTVGNRTLTFGHVSLGDYARERLGI